MPAPRRCDRHRAPARAGSVRALEEPEIPVARGVDETFHRPVLTPVIDEDRGRDLIPIPRIVRVILVIALDPPGRHIDSDRGRRVEVVAGASVSYPWKA